nr:MAG TPA: hypothetical protein [Caudoviricetes sp.]DAW18599.1 MAG TPA: hypothetical protein [Caudoviricetes sp.]
MSKTRDQNSIQYPTIRIVEAKKIVLFGNLWVILPAESKKPPCQVVLAGG